MYFSHKKNETYIGEKQHWKDVEISSIPPSINHLPIITDGLHVGWEINFDASFQSKLTEVIDAFQVAMMLVSANYTAEDIASFSTQEAEAKAYEADQNADTPLLDFMVANRPSIDKPTLVSRILANSVIYKQVAGPAIGKKQHYEDLLYSLKEQHEDPNQPDAMQADFDAIVVDFS
ncbi:hypothetical protein [Methylophaga sp.]|uniref:hypothetical protein n=1 Tax=Methylophaga sp. TaxID=2024840 RepID=UPI0025E211D5|nr:hypothetical protein [Methylophaga sp.]